MAESTKLQVRVEDELKGWLEGRARRSFNQGSADLRIRTEVQLWRGHLVEELARQSWTLGEIGCIADILNGTIIPDWIGTGAVLGELAEAFALDPGSWAEKWGINEDDLVNKVRRLGPTETHALADAVARWWADQESEHSTEGWAKVGVRVTV